MSQASLADSAEPITVVRKALAQRQQACRRRLGTPWPFCTHWPVVLPIVLMAAMTAVFRWTPLDLMISSWFYDPQTHLWNWLLSPPCQAFYRLGIYPPFVLVVIGGALVIFGWLIDGTDSLPRAGLFLVLLMLLGPGLIVNLGFKTHWGRPRPHEVQQFHGRHPFSPVGSPGPMTQGNSSFPSGHAALAFYMASPGFLVSRRRPRVATALILFGGLYGVGMSAARVAQGGHFTSDVLWSAGIMYLLAALLARVVLREEKEAQA